MKKVLAIILALVLAFSFVACGTQQSAQPSENNSSGAQAPESETGTTTETSDEPIKIALLFPLSGNSASVGEDATRGLKMFVDYINENGGVKSLGGRKIEVIYADTQSSEEAAATEAERLINQEGVSLITGCYQSAVTAAVQIVCERYETPLLICCSTGDMLTEGAHPFSYRFHEQNSDSTKTQLAVIKMLKEKYGDINTAALLYQNDDWGQSLHEGWTAGLDEIGVEVVIDETFAANATDMTTVVTKLVSKQPDIILNACYFDPMVMLTNTMAGKGYAPKVCFGTSAGEAQAEFLPTVGDNANGFLTVSGWSPDILTIKGMTWISDLYNESYEEPINTEVVGGWMAGYIIYRGFEDAASADPIAVNNAIKALHITTDDPMSPYPYDVEFDQITGANIHASAMVGQFQEEGIKLVYPEAAVMEGVTFVYPCSLLSPVNK